MIPTAYRRNASGLRDQRDGKADKNGEGRGDKPGRGMDKPGKSKSK